jgi:4'-phosphopantetheinyl transferase
MNAVVWHVCRITEVPDDDDWLTDDERVVMSGLAIAKRRADWRLGRWTAKRLLSAELQVPMRRVEIRSAGDGAPDAFVDGVPAEVSLSLSHRDGVAVAALARPPTTVGIDLETLESRSDAFVREWLSGEERATLAPSGTARDLQVLCCWTGKEASAKVLREGLRLDVRRAVVVAGPPDRSWTPLTVTWRADACTHRGWWCHDDSRVIAVVTDPPTPAPVASSDRCIAS